MLMTVDYKKLHFIIRRCVPKLRKVIFYKHSRPRRTKKLILIKQLRQYNKVVVLRYENATDISKKN
jgi:hypothetical protein